MKKYLVTGGFGNIGLPLVNQLIDDQHYVFVIDNLSNKDSLDRFNQMNFKTRVTYTSLEYFPHIWSDVQFDAIIHLAGRPNSDTIDSEYVQAFEDTVINTMHVIHRCIQQNTKLIYLFWPDLESGLYQFLHLETLRLINYYQETKNLPVTLINTNGLSSVDSICKKIISEL